MICSKCYNVVDDRAVICPHCGCVPSDSDSVQIVPDKTNKALAFLSFILSALIPEGVIFGFLIWASKTDLQPKSARVYGMCAIIPWLLRWLVPKIVKAIVTIAILAVLLLLAFAFVVVIALVLSGVITIPGLALA